MRKSIKWFVIAVALLAGAAFFYLWRDDPATGAGSGAGLKTARIVRDNLSREVVATGVIRPVVGAEIKVGSRVSGIVKSLPVRVGDKVKAGDLLAEIDPTAFEALVQQATAELELGKAQLALAETNFARKQKLTGQGYNAEADLQTSLRDLNVARAQISLNEARVRSARINLGYTRITAPIAGVIADVTTREGETVAANFAAPTFVSIVDLSRLEVQAFVDETDIGRVYPGQDAVFQVDTYPETEFEAKVTAINPKAELQNNVVNYVVVLSFQDREDRILRPEMTAHVRLKLEERKGVLTAPRNALRRENGRQVVMLKRGDGWVEQPVTVGWRMDQQVEIVEGLKENDIIQINPTGGATVD